MKKRTFAVIGYGGQGGWHARQILASDVAALAGVYDIDEAKNKAAERHGMFAYPSLEAVLADEKVEAVVIATPNASHKALAVKALEAGKNVVCEKPVEMSCAAFDEMTSAAARAGKLFTVHQNRRWDVDYLAIKRMAASGEIGGVIRLESRIHGSRGIPSDWRRVRAEGGGMLLDWGVHLIDQALQIVREKIVRVCCDQTHITCAEVDDGFRLHLDFESGKTAYLEVGTYYFLALPRFYMLCERGSAKIEDWRQNAQVAFLKAWNEKDVMPVQAAAGITKTMAPRDERTLDIHEADRPVSDVHDFYRNFCAALDGREPILVTHQEVRRVLQVIEAAFQSAEEKQSVRTEI